MRAFIHDAYAALSHKAVMSDTRRPGVASWVPADDARRLAAYRILAAYRDNVARHYLPDSFSDPQIAKYREYGDAGRLCIAARTSLLGDEQTLAAPALGRDSSAPKAEQEAAQKALDYLRGWAIKERLWLKMALAESDAVSLGDGVYVLGWNVEAGRPRLRRYDPGFYFPALTDDDEYPRRVHLAWEETVDGRPYLHRLTWQLARIRPAYQPDPLGMMRDRMYAYTDDGLPVPQPGDRLDADGQLVRTYPWATRPSTTTCLFSHGVWDLSKLGGSGDVHDLDERNARWQVGPDGQEQRELDLRIDFVPVVHVPNTPTGPEHFGLSVLLLVAQLLDDVASTDTDLAETGVLAGSATLVTKGTTPVDLTAGPGSRLDLPAGGTAEYLDTSKNLDALLKLAEALKDRLSQNSRVSNVSLGRVDASNAVSGFALDLSFAPEEGLVRELRAVRDEKYPLLLKMVLRLEQQFGSLPAGPTPTVTVQLGSFKPSDEAEAIKQVTAALEAGAMSTHTAVLTLQRAGFPIEDAEREVTRIRAEQFEKADKLLDVLGEDGLELVYGFLGLPIPDHVKKRLQADRGSAAPADEGTGGQ